MLLPALSLLVLTFADSTAVGIRYLLILLPLFYVWIGGLAKLPDSKFLIACLAALQLLATMPYFPHYIGYFNPLAGGPQGGYRYVRGSDVDWGQGLKSLKRYLDRNGIESVTLDYFGCADPSFYGIRYRRIDRQERQTPKNSVYAISRFQREKSRWTRDFKPTATVAYAIDIYDLRNCYLGERPVK